MARSLNALFRGSDGRSLARALACLLLINALVAGFHNSAAAAGSSTLVLCTVDTTVDTGSAHTTAPDSDDHRAPCCAAGCVAAAVALPPPTAVELRVTVDDPIAAPASHDVPIALRIDNHSARGPPSVLA